VWVFVPLFNVYNLALFLIVALLSIPYFALYPDLHATTYDIGTERERAIINRYRRFTSRVSFWTRLRRVLTCWAYRKQSRRPIVVVEIRN
jgi:hypothetical protein